MPKSDSRVFWLALKHMCEVSVCRADFPRHCPEKGIQLWTETFCESRRNASPWRANLSFYPLVLPQCVRYVYILGSFSASATDLL